MASTLASLFFLSLSATSAAPKTALLDVAPVTPADAAVARVLTDALAAPLQASLGGELLTTNDVRSLMKTAADQRLLGCTDDRCVADHGNVLAVEQIVSGRVTRIGKDLLLTLALIDVKAARVLARSSTVFQSPADLSKVGLSAPGKEQPTVIASITSALSTATKALVGPVGQARGDQALSELRMAVLVETDDESASPAKLSALESCVQDELLSAGATLVSAEQVARLRGATDARRLTRGELPDQLTTAEVDVIVVGLAQFHPGKGPGKVETSEADLSLRVVKIDSAEILASKQMRKLGNGFSANAAEKDATTKLCADVREALGTAMSKKAERGTRVVVELEGADELDDVAKVVAVLAKAPGVAVRARRFDKKKSVIDVTVAGGDGVSLVLGLGRSALPMQLVRAEAGRVQLALRELTAEEKTACNGRPAEAFFLQAGAGPSCK